MLQKLTHTKSEEIRYFLQCIENVDITSCFAFEALVSIFEYTSTYLVCLCYFPQPRPTANMKCS